MPDEDKHIANLGEQHELVRLNTYIRKDLDRQLALGRVYGHGTKGSQANDAVRIYLALFRGYGDLTPEERRQIREYLDGA